MTNRRHHRRSSTDRKRRMCTEKARFSNVMTAMMAGARLGMDWYRCPYCGGWHLTSRNGVSRRRDAERGGEAGHADG